MPVQLASAWAKPPSTPNSGAHTEYFTLDDDSDCDPCREESDCEACQEEGCDLTLLVPTPTRTRCRDRNLLVPTPTRARVTSFASWQTSVLTPPHQVVDPGTPQRLDKTSRSLESQLDIAKDKSNESLEASFADGADKVACAVRARGQMQQLTAQLRLSEIHCAELRGRSAELQTLISMKDDHLQAVDELTRVIARRAPVLPASSPPSSLQAGVQTQLSEERALQLSKLSQVVDELTDSLDAATSREHSGGEQVAELKAKLGEERSRRERVEKQLLAQKTCSDSHREELLARLAVGSRLLEVKRIRVEALEAERRRMEALDAQALQVLEEAFEVEAISAKP